MSQDSSKRALIRKLKRWAEERFPLMFPVRVYLRPPQRMNRHLGYFDMDESCDRGVICLCTSLDSEALIETFCEEWAHARTTYLSDEEETDEDPHHHQTFWAEYGRIVQASRKKQW